MAIKELLVSGDDAAKVCNERKKEYVFKRVLNDDIDSYLTDGWEIVSKLKTKTKIRKRKKQDEIFENRIWCLLYKMGYTHLNKNRHCDIEYKDKLTKQIDVFAVDSDTVLVIECKSTETFLKPATFKQNIESYDGIMPGLTKNIQKEFGNKKVIFIYATNNYDLGDKDKERLKSFNLIHFNEDSVAYYEQLANHLGFSAKYQLLGTLLKGDEIPSLNLDIPAIQGSMGKHTFYSFLIEPSKLLKIGFVLHRNNVYSTPEMMPTYQRIIKKERLKAVREFINNDGYFPNSIIVSLTTKKPLIFEPLKQNSDDSISKMGVLHLPRQYQCAYIIDGQHRLYGYSESRFSETHTIPVVAFENLEKEEQVKMFMDINENQKQVPKQLRNTLEIDLLWGAKREDLKRRAVMLAISQRLGEEKKSPLYLRVVTGENKKTPERTLTLENLRIAFFRSGLFNSYKSNKVEKDGLLDLNDNEKTCNFIFEIVLKYFTFIRNNLIDEWDNKTGYLLTNNAIGALIILLGDMIFLEKEKKSIKLHSNSVDEVYKSIEIYLIGLVDALKDLNDEDRQFLKTQKGGSAPQKCREFIGYKLHTKLKEFLPSWLPDYINNSCQDNHDEALKMLNVLLQKLKSTFSKILSAIHGSKWQSLGIPDSVYKKLNEDKSSKERENDIKGVEKDYTLLDFANYDDYSKICHYASNWKNGFKECLAFGEYSTSEVTASNLNTIQTYFERVKKKGNLSKDEFNLLKGYHDHIVNKTEKK